MLGESNELEAFWWVVIIRYGTIPSATSWDLRYAADALSNNSM